MKRLPLFVLFACISVNLKAQSWQDTINIINHFFDRYKAGNPGCQLSISRNGKIVYSMARGLADVERNVPYTTQTITEPGSITKQITAAAVLLLEQQGKLSLNDDVRKYIPELPNYGHIITLGNLLHHTSGIREWSDLEAITGWPRTTKAYTNEDAFSLICRQARLNNIPGAEFIYSNSNYLLLTIVIERLTGMKLPDFTKKYIFEPAGMTHTLWRDDFKKIVPNRGLAYIKRDGHYRLNMPNESVYGPGGLLTTTEDLLKWTNFYLSNKLGNPGLLEKQLKVATLPQGAIATYAAGLFIGKFRGYDIISHTGQTAGYVGVVESLPALKLSVAWLSNTTEFTDSLYVGITAIDNLFIKDKTITENKKAGSTPVIPISKTQKYTGWYRDNKRDRGLKITLRHDTLFADNTPLIPVNENEFSYYTATIKFNAGYGFTLTDEDKVNTTFIKGSPAVITPVYLRSLTGTYYSKETESSFKLAYKNGKLLFSHGYWKDVALQPTYKGGFNFYLDADSDMGTLPANILFESNGKKTSGECLVSIVNVRGLRFVKIH